jgi:5-methylcytosine-specific restriction endonuclease McrA
MLSNACPKVPADGKTRREARAERNAAIETEWRRVCRAVDARDGKRCRVCERMCSPNAMDMLLRAERHHLLPRSLGGQDTTANLLTVCPKCHDDRHVHGTLRLSGNADERNEMLQLAGVKVERLSEAGWTVEAFV